MVGGTPADSSTRGRLQLHQLLRIFGKQDKLLNYVETTNKRQLIFISCRPTVWGHQRAAYRPQCDTIHQVSLTYSAYFRSSRKQRKEFSLKAARQSAASCGPCARNVCPLFGGDTARICSFILNSSPGPAQLPRSSTTLVSSLACASHTRLCVGSRSMII